MGLGEVAAWKRRRGPFEACLFRAPGRADGLRGSESVQVVARQVSAFSMALDGLVMALEGESKAWARVGTEILIL